jgi:hypothetical protein
VIGLRFSPGWAVGAFFIPILNLFRPCQVMSEVWRGSVILAGKTDDNSVRRVALSPMVGLWWGLFLLANLSGSIAGVVYEGADTVAALATASVVEIFAYLVAISAALVAALLVRRVTALQVEARVRMSEEEEPTAT